MDESEPVSEIPAGSVLLVEDEPDVRLVLVEALEEAGLSVAAAPGQNEAERLLAARDGRGFDVLVTDLALDDGDGGALIDQASILGMPSICITGCLDRVPHGVPVGPQALLTKPFRLERLVMEIARALQVAQPKRLPRPH